MGNSCTYFQTTVNADIQDIDSLEELNLSQNELRDIPLEIGVLQRLTRLDLSSNRLKEFPICVASLTNLNCLNVSRNEIRMLT